MTTCDASNRERAREPARERELAKNPATPPLHPSFYGTESTMAGWGEGATERGAGERIQVEEGRRRRMQTKEMTRTSNITRGRRIKHEPLRL